jgi:hypothetical protein
MRFGLAVPVLLVAFAAARAEDEPAPKERTVAVAVIVHPDNPTKELSLGELRAYLKLERQFWPNKKRCEVYLPPSRSTEYGILLDVVYQKTHKKLQKYWVRKLFAGEISAKPSFVPSSAAAVKRVKKSKGALSVIPADAVPKGVRVLLIDDKKPGEKGYPLIGKKPEPKSP